MRKLEPAGVELETFTARDPASFPGDSFAGLVAPLSQATFLRDYWGARPFFVKRNRPGHFDALVTVEEAAELLATTVFHAGEIRVACDGALLPADRFTRGGVVDTREARALFNEGATVVFEHLDRKHAGLLRLVTACEDVFRVPFRTNAYLTPAGSRGFGLHYDTHDVIILQVRGSKTWQVHDSPVDLPHEEQKCNRERAAGSRRIAEIELQPGDVLYLPRGYIHGAAANADTSFHVTMGIRSLTLRDVYLTALKRTLLSRREFRKVALFGDIGADVAATRQALAEAIAEVDLVGALEDADLSFMRKRTRPFPGRIVQALTPGEPGPRSRLRLSPGAIVRIADAGDATVLAFDGQFLRFPAGARAALERVAVGDEFHAAELPGLEEGGGLLLARKLHACRLLDVVEDVPADAVA